MKISFPSDRSQLECESYPGLQFLPCSFHGLQVSGNLSQVLLRKISLCYLRSFTEMSQNTSLISSGWSLLARAFQTWVGLGLTPSAWRRHANLSSFWRTPAVMEHLSQDEATQQLSPIFLVKIPLVIQRQQRMNHQLSPLSWF